MSKTLLIDFESTGLDTNTARITEVGAQLVDQDYNVLNQVSTLVYEPDYPALTPDIIRITGINPVELAASGIPFASALEMVAQLVDGELKYVVAHNANYDESLFRAEVIRHDQGMNPAANWLLSSPWLCSMTDIESNYAFKSWKLMHLALEYMVPVDPRILHRAVNDVDLMRQMMQAAGATPQQMLEFRNTPWVYLRAQVRKPWEDNGESTTKAKARGFSWEKAKGDDRVHPKAWVKRVKAHRIADEQNTEFNVTVIEE